MNALATTAAVLAALLALAHGVGGELTSVRALRRERTSEGDKLELRATWHLYTWQLSLSAAALLAMSAGLAPDRDVLRWLVVASFVGSGAVILVFAATRGVRTVVRYPQWVLLSAVGVLAWWATRPSR